MHHTRKVALALAGAAIAAGAFAATVAAAGPHGNGATQAQAQAPGGQGGAAGDVATSVLGLTRAEIQAQRQNGLSLAQIAAKQAVDPTRLIEAFTARWSERIDARVTAGALTSAEAATLKGQLAVRAKDMVYRTTLGGMRGAAVGAGPGQGAGGAGAGRGSGARNGACDGTGPGTAAQP